MRYNNKNYEEDRNTKQVRQIQFVKTKGDYFNNILNKI
jgi:hypothetical protein